MINIRDLIVNQGFARAILGGGSAEPPEIKLQEKTITENGEYTADAGFDALSKVLVEVASTGKTVTVTKGSRTAASTGADMSVPHRQGVIPDLIVVLAAPGAGTVSGNGAVFGIAQKTGSNLMYRETYFMTLNSGTLTYSSSTTTGLDSTASASVVISKCDDTNFTIIKPIPKMTYEYITFSGLL